MAGINGVGNTAWYQAITNTRSNTWLFTLHLLKQFAVDLAPGNQNQVVKFVAILIVTVVTA